MKIAKFQKCNLSDVPFIILIILSLAINNMQYVYTVRATTSNIENTGSPSDNNSSLPKIKDNRLKVELVARQLSHPTSMSFIDKNNILVREKNGTISLVTIGSLQAKRVAEFAVDHAGEDGLLGITTINEVGNISQPTGDSKTEDENKTSVFLYMTQIENGHYKNRVYAFHWSNGTLVDERLILELPGGPHVQHVGGKLAIGPDGKLYTAIGDLLYSRGVLQNIKAGPKPDNTSAIIRTNLDGLPPKNNPFSNISSMRYIFAYGIRNSFGLAFDPITGNLWDTENGPERYDEINIVHPGFNGGWVLVMGPISDNIDKSKLVSFPGSKYYDPVFSWYNVVGPTSIEFLKSSKLGSKYTNNIFVGDYNGGDLYYFELNQSRTGIRFGDVQKGNFVADNSGKLSEITFGTGFERITDIKTGPDGFLYILSYDGGKIFRIVPQ